MSYLEDSLADKQLTLRFLYNVIKDIIRKFANIPRIVVKR